MDIGDQNEDIVAGFGGFPGIGGFVGLGTAVDKAFEVNQLFQQRAREYENFKIIKTNPTETVFDISSVEFKLADMKDVISNIQKYQSLVNEYDRKKKEYNLFCDNITRVENGLRNHKDSNIQVYNLLEKYPQYKRIEETYEPVFEAILQELYDKQSILEKELDAIIELKKKGYEVITAVYNVCKEKALEVADLKNPCGVCMGREINSCLPCGHTFCDGCISQTETSIRQKKCSVCRATYQRPIKLYLD
jgi:hypothetical protein